MCEYFPGLGSVFTYTVALNTNIINFPAKHTGKLVGLLNAFFAGSPSIFGTLYYKLFATGDPTEPSNQNFGGFMLFFAILFGVVDILCILFLRKYPNEHDVSAEMYAYKDSNGVIIGDTEAVIVTENGKNDINASTAGYTLQNGYETQRESDSEEGTCFSIRNTICNLDFELFIWMFAFASSVSLVYGNNITVTSRSVSLNSYNDKLIIIIPITNCVISAVTGILSDQLKERIPRLVLVVLGMCCFVVSQVLVMLFADDLTWLVIATVFIGIGTGIIWSLCPTIMKERFSVEHLGRNWGLALFVASLVAYASQLMFGKLYDSHVPENTVDNYCYGKDCITEGYGAFLTVAVMAVILGVLLSLKKRCC